MSKKLYLIVLLALVVSLLALPIYGADSRLRVAVLPFDDGAIQGQDRWWSGDWNVGKGVSDELVTALFNSGKFRVIEREQLDRVLEEQHLSSSGRIDSHTAARIGRILGVQILIMGKVTEFSTDSKGGMINVDDRHSIGLGIKSNTARVTIDARMVDTTSAEIKAAVSGRGEKKKTSLAISVDYNSIAFGSNEFKKTNLGIALRDAVNDVAAQLADRSTEITPAAPTVFSPSAISCRVATVYGSQIYLNAGANQGVKNGMKFKVFRIIRTVKDPSTGKVIDYITEPIAKIQVTKVKSSSAICVIHTRINSKYRITKNDLVKQI
ncbi:MAG TPA: CsgG/HfaB family protein [Bacillota bacterium]|nr:CsgG/HfaB family protein [Bacillota bacterium]